VQAVLSEDPLVSLLSHVEDNPPKRKAATWVDPAADGSEESFNASMRGRVTDGVRTRIDCCRLTNRNDYVLKEGFSCMKP